MLIATPLGVALAIGLARWTGWGARPANFLMLFPLVTPEIVMGVALFLVFVHLFGFVQLGTMAQVLGHVTFTVSYVVIVVRGRLFSVGRDYEEAAMDLGASRLQALRTVLLPMLAPAIWSSLMVAFAISIDDFVISAFLMGDASSATIPVKLYSAARLAPSPAINALASILLFASMLAIAIAILVMRRSRKKEGTARLGGRGLRPAGSLKSRFRGSCFVVPIAAGTVGDSAPSIPLSCWSRCAARAGPRTAGAPTRAPHDRRPRPLRRWPSCTGSGPRGPG